MSHETAHTELSSILEEQPDLLTFRAIRAILDTWPQDNTFPSVFRHVEDSIADWPDEIRQVDCVPEQLGPLVRSPSWKLVRAVRLRGSADLLMMPAIMKAGGNLTNISFDSIGGSKSVSNLDLRKQFPRLCGLSLNIGIGITSKELKRFLWEQIPQYPRHLEFSVLADNQHWSAIAEYLTGPNSKQVHTLKLYRPPHGFIRGIVKQLPVQLRNLTCSVTKIDSDDMKALLAAEFVSHLQELDLSDNGLGDVGVEALAKSTRLQSLHNLNLEGNDIGPNGARELGKVSWIHALRRFRLSFNPLQDSGCRYIMNTPFESLQSLGLQQIECGDDGALDLARNCDLLQLGILNVYGNRIGDKGMCSLIESPNLVGLRSLRIDYNPCSSETIHKFAECPMRLNDLGVSGIRTTSADLNGILQNSAFSGMRRAYFAGSGLGSTGARILADENLWSKIHVLDIAHAELGDEGLKALVHGDILRTIWVLLLAEVIPEFKFGDDGVRMFAESNNIQSLVDLTLVGINDGAKAIEQIAKECRLYRIDRIELEKPCYKYFRPLRGFRAVTRAFIRHCRKSGCPF